jgi:hypothetical protein
MAAETATDSGVAREAPAFLRAAAEPVRQQLGSSVLLADFLRGAGKLTLDERRILVEQALVLFDQNYAHLPLKVAMHAVNPVQRLRLLRDRLARQTAQTADAEWVFHAEMSEIFHSVRDLHTNYLLPEPFSGKIAYLPFLVEEYHDQGAQHYVVSHIMQGFSAPGFEPGAEITHWSGIPIERAIDLNAARFAGSNLAARHSRGVQSLTIRSLRIHLPPDEEWVTLSYVGVDGTPRELREEWRVVDNLPPLADADAVSPQGAAIGVDLGADETGRGQRLLFAPHTVAQELDFRATGELPSPAADDANLPTTLPQVFRARSITTSSGTFGHVRIFTFSVDDEDAFVSEFIRLIEQLPQQGLIVDVRGNGGGLIYASEFTLQTLTPRPIQPEPVQFINTPLNLQICRKHKDNPAGIDLGPWFPSMDQAVETAATFSNAFPITPADKANAIGQRYHGPVVLITDARCYSATDIFAAGFQDHNIGPVLGVDDDTGAGGANVWTQDLLKQLLEVPTPDANSPYQPLPRGAGMRVAIRRTLRVGSLAGTPVEDLGVRPTELHQLTRNDVLGDNADLLEHAGDLLAAMPVRKLTVDVTKQADGSLRVDLDVANLDRTDVFVDGRPRASVDLTGPNAAVTIPGLPDAASVRVEGYLKGELAAVRVATV